MIPIVFYTKPGCHLCEDGQWMLETALKEAPAIDCAVDYVDITDDAALQARYGLRIPVLHRLDVGAELDWPFTPDDILRWLGVPQ